MASAMYAAFEDLPVEKKQEVLDFVEFVHARSVPKRPRRSIVGLWADLNVDITEEDIAEARREMWGNLDRKFEDL
jgi:hypothetical protein